MHRRPVVKSVMQRVNSSMDTARTQSSFHRNLRVCHVLIFIEAMAMPKQFIDFCGSVKEMQNSDHEPLTFTKGARASRCDITLLVAEESQHVLKFEDALKCLGLQLA